MVLCLQILNSMCYVSAENQSSLSLKILLLFKANSISETASLKLYYLFHLCASLLAGMTDALEDVAVKGDYACSRVLES